MKAFCCKRGFPWPIIDETLILAPFSKDERRSNPDMIRKAFENYGEIYKELKKIEEEQNKFYKFTAAEMRGRPMPSKPETIHFEEFMDLNLNNRMTKVEYIEALRVTIERTTVFLQRTSDDFQFNPYNTEIMLRHRANMDIQFVTDSHGAATYLTSYMLKGDSVINNTIQTAINEVQKEQLPLKRKFQMIATPRSRSKDD